MEHHSTRSTSRCDVAATPPEKKKNAQNQGTFEHDRICIIVGEVGNLSLSSFDLGRLVRVTQEKICQLQ